MRKSTDIRVRDAALYFLPIEARMPIKFGPETLTSVTCARVRVTVEDRHGRHADGWGETPLSVQWAWPSAEPYEPRHQAMKDFCAELIRAWRGFNEQGHPLEIGYDFQRQQLLQLLERFNPGRDDSPMPYLAALICLSAIDLAIHDAFGNLHGVDVYRTYTSDWLSRDLAGLLEPADPNIRFQAQYPADYLVSAPPTKLPAWHLVGGLDPLSPDEVTADHPRDGYPVLLADWIKTDGLKCIKVKLRGNDADWDYQRLVRVGRISVEHGAEWLTADFNCTVTDPQYVCEILDRFAREHPELSEMLLYVEQPFPYDLQQLRINVREVSARKPLFLDESAHDWQHVRLGRELGWSGVALKTCKTQTGAILSICWAKAHGMPLMVQDLSNPMLAQIPHVRLAAHAGTIMGVETNGMQFYPDASRPEAQVHHGLYRRRGGQVDLSTLSGPGFGYRLAEIRRELPPPQTV
jgi:L-alanine-DL-glutamate epimerase-like enolase superfamily enzyme